MVDEVVCPDCGAKETDTLKHIFNPRGEAAIRLHDGWAECVKCGTSFEIDRLSDSKEDNTG